MPFIDSKISMKVSDEQKETLKAALGAAAGIIGKPESFVMIGFQDEYTLFFGGKKLEKGAYVEVSLYGNAASKDYDKLTGQICDMLAEKLGIPGSAVYVTYHPITDWGWNGANF